MLPSFIYLFASLLLVHVSYGAVPSSLKVEVFSSSSDATNLAVGYASVPPGYKLIGGGIKSDYYIENSYPFNTTTWYAAIRIITADAGPISTPSTIYAVGLYDPDNLFETQVFKNEASSAGSSSNGIPVGTVSVDVPAPYVLTSGGGQSVDGLYLFESYPNTHTADATSTNTWTASCTYYPSFVGPTTPKVTAYAIGIKPTGSGYTVGNTVNNADHSVTSSKISHGDVFQLGAAAGPLTPSSVVSGGGYRCTYSLATSTYPKSSLWQSNSTISPAATNSADLLSFAVGLSLSVTSSGTSSGSGPTSSGSGSTTGSNAGECAIQITQTMANSWQDGSSTFSQYTVRLTNTGASNSRVLLQLSGSITQYWNMIDAGNSVLALPSYAPSINAGGYFEFGYIIRSSGVTSSQINLVEPSCGSSPASTGSGSTTGICSGDTCTNPTATSSTQSANVCHIGVTTTVANSWISAGVTQTQLNVVVSNTGATTITALSLLGDASVSAIVQIWNLQAATGATYTAPSFATPLSPGASFTFGYIQNMPAGSTTHVAWQLNTASC